jgi:hypothetical protein
MSQRRPLAAAEKEAIRERQLKREPTAPPGYRIIVAVDEETDADRQPFVNSYRREKNGDGQRQPGVIACLCRAGARAKEKMLPRDVS